ncbi:DUF664 domain-containing protein [Arthrobacter sp. NEB 688]|uniref:mycothiol transferase n=1 Tax=Arthrobacter sp. NEB 688 TaxID=904039 RepID=UPI001565581F|nr:DUF664 domain-containing protein [Arthrobacter sp. NEB 688]QKE83080.1 DUF664 domain-containing protein [Arthrobacter sp. NEB 688]
MSTTPPPWEPPLAGSEAEQLLGSLDRMRATFRYKVDGLDAEGLRATIPSSTLSLAALLKHLASVEDFYSTQRLSGTPMPDVWDDNGWDDEDDWEMTSAASDPPEDLYALYDGAVERNRARVREAVAERGLGGAAHASDGEGRHASIRRLLFDLLEEYGRHTGHADLLREAVDGRVGEDPSADWHLPEAWTGA